MAIHYMKLNSEPFRKIKSGQKTVELRLNDEKRQLVNMGDSIEFTDITSLEKLTVTVKALYKFADFKQLYMYFDKVSLGYGENEKADYRDMEKYYPAEMQSKYGTLAIVLELGSDTDGNRLN